MGQTGNTIRLHRVLRAPPIKVYKAFTDPQAIQKWFPPNGFTAAVHEFDPRPGGKFRTSFTNFSTGTTHYFGGTFLEMEPGKLLKYTDTFEDPNLPGEISVTVKFKEVPCGTDLTIVQEGVPVVIPESDCYLGWQDSLRLLSYLVEADIKEE